MGQTSPHKCMCRAGIDLASVEVRFQNLSIDADIAVGARGEPTVLNAYRNKLEVGTLALVAATELLHVCCVSSMLRAAPVVQVCIGLAVCAARCQSWCSCGLLVAGASLVFLLSQLTQFHSAEPSAIVAHHEAKQAALPYSG